MARIRREGEGRRRARSILSGEFREHLRAAVREGLLAIASLCEEALRGMEAGTRRARRRVERIPVRGPARQGRPKAPKR